MRNTLFGGVHGMSIFGMPAGPRLPVVLMSCLLDQDSAYSACDMFCEGRLFDEELTYATLHCQRKV